MCALLFIIILLSILQYELCEHSTHLTRCQKLAVKLQLWRCFSGLYQRSLLSGHHKSDQNGSVALRGSAKRQASLVKTKKAKLML